MTANLLFVSIATIFASVTLMGLSITKVERFPATTSIEATEHVYVLVSVDSKEATEAWLKIWQRPKGSDQWGPAQWIKFSSYRSNTFRIDLEGLAENSEVSYGASVYDTKRQRYDQKETWYSFDIKGKTPMNFNVELDGKKLQANTSTHIEAVSKTILLSSTSNKIGFNVAVSNSADPRFKEILNFNEFLIKKEITLEAKNSKKPTVFTIKGVAPDAVDDEYTIIMKYPEKNFDIPASDQISRLKIDFPFNAVLKSAFSEFEDHKTYVQSSDLTKKPNIFIIFFDTLRKDFALNFAPNMQKFMNENVTPEKHWVNGTSTAYSVFSLFHGLPAFLTYKYILTEQKDPENYGSFPLKILKHNGYKITVIGQGYNCLRNNQPFDDIFKWQPMLLYSFGSMSRLVDSCYDSSSLINQTSLPSNDPGIVDLTINEIARSVVKNPNDNFGRDPRIFFIGLYDVHDPYTWSQARLNNPLIPSQNSSSFNEFNFDILSLRNSYINAVMDADNNFKTLYNAIIEHGGEDSIIVLMSDHGERLGEKIAHDTNWDQQIGHGKRGFRERIEGVMSIKFGNDSVNMKNKISSKVFSTQDVFVTIFDYLKMKYNPLPQDIGKSLFSHSRNSTTSVRASGTAPTREIILSNDQYKVWLNLDKEKDNDFFDLTKGATIFDITDIDDNPVFHKKPFAPACDPADPQRSDVKCRELIFDMFKDAIRDLAPEAKL